MLIVRLARHGRKKVPFYHLVVAEKTCAVKKKFVANLGYFDPLADKGKGSITFDNEKLDFYVKNGAQMSQSAARILSKAGYKDAGSFIKARVTKPKKEAPAPEPKEEPPAEEAAETSSPEAEAPAEKTEEPVDASADTESPQNENETPKD